MKIGKEEIAGLVTAVERVLAHDFAVDAACWERRVQVVVDALGGIPGVRARRVIDTPEDHELHPVPIPRAWVELPDGETRNLVLKQLRAGTPPISVRPVGKRVVVVAPEALQDGQEMVVAARLRDALLSVRLVSSR